MSSIQLNLLFFLLSNFLCAGCVHEMPTSSTYPSLNRVEKNFWPIVSMTTGIFLSLSFTFFFFFGFYFVPLSLRVPLLSNLIDWRLLSLFHSYRTSCRIVCLLIFSKCGSWSACGVSVINPNKCWIEISFIFHDEWEIIWISGRWGKLLIFLFQENVDISK